MITIDLPWPSKDLSPNSRCHWAVKAKAVKKARHDAYWLAHTAERVGAGYLTVWLTFSPPTKGRYDDDNLVARCKSYLDGIADALGVDDSRFRMGQMTRGAPIKRGNVRVEIEADQVSQEAA